MDELDLGIEFEDEFGLDSERDDDDEEDNDFWSLSHGPKCDDDEVKQTFLKKSGVPFLKYN